MFLYIIERKIVGLGGILLFCWAMSKERIGCGAVAYFSLIVPRDCECMKIVGERKSEPEMVLAVLCKSHTMCACGIIPRTDFSNGWNCLSTAL